jgi:hypothetical protein
VARPAPAVCALCSWVGRCPDRRAVSPSTCGRLVALVIGSPPIGTERTSDPVVSSLVGKERGATDGFSRGWVGSSLENLETEHPRAVATTTSNLSQLCRPKGTRASPPKLQAPSWPPPRVHYRGLQGLGNLRGPAEANTAPPERASTGPTHRHELDHGLLDLLESPCWTPQGRRLPVWGSGRLAGKVRDEGSPRPAARSPASYAVTIGFMARRTGLAPMRPVRCPPTAWLTADVHSGAPPALSLHPAASPSRASCTLTCAVLLAAVSPLATPTGGPNLEALRGLDLACL